MRAIINFAHVMIFFLFSILLIPSALSVLINEFTVDPQSDWNADGDFPEDNEDEWIELYNPLNETIVLSNWFIVMNDSLTVNASVQQLTGTILPKSYEVILDPQGTMNLNGQILLYNNLGQLIDSVTYGNWNDTNINDNALDGNANSTFNECLARIPNGQDTNNDKNDFTKTRCTYGTENGIIPGNQQDLNVTIAGGGGGLVVFQVLPRSLEFGIVQPGSINNSALNGPIIFNTTGSNTNVTVEITEVFGSPFDIGLKIDDHSAIGSLWTILTSSPIKTAVPTLNVPAQTTPGNKKGTIVYTITGLP
jgi:hypothetical protein